MAKYFLHALIFFIAIFSDLLAYEGTSTYEKFFRLNKPKYQSSSGDWIGFTYKDDPPTKDKDTYTEGALRLYFQDNNSVNYSLQEAYFRFIGSSYKLFIGRKILDWNQNEKYWQLGYLNATQSFTLLSDIEEGVTGILINKEIDNFEFDLLLSYLFIPQVNPSVTFKNGEVESHSEWMRLPPKYTVVNGTVVPIYYKVNKINYGKILLNKSLGGNVTYRWKNGGISAFAVYKPENKVRINAEAYYDNISLNKVIVTADPTVNHHAYYGVQLFQEFGDVKVRGGLSYVDPNARLGKDVPLFEIQNARKTFYSDYFTIAPRYDIESYSHLSANLFRDKYDLSFNYIHLLSKNIRSADDFFSDAVKWKRAIGIGLTYYFYDNLSLLGDLKYDMARRDNILRIEAKYNYHKKVYMSLGLEVLKAPDDNSYWSYYRANDTLYSSIGFYF